MRIFVVWSMLRYTVSSKIKKQTYNGHKIWFFNYCGKNRKLDWPNRARTVLASFSFYVFMDLDFVSVHKNAKRELGQYPAILTSRLVNNIYIQEMSSLGDMVENYPSPETVQKYIKAKNELDKISYDRTRGACVRSKARWHEFGERSSKYLF